MCPTLKAVSLVDALFETLRQQILDGSLGERTALTELGVASQYEVARPTAKAALERLVHYGLVRRGPSKTAHVPALGPEDVRDLYRSRTLLEREVLSALARTRTVPPAARRALVAFDEAVGSGSHPHIVEADVAFHRSLVNALDSPRVTRMYDSVIGEAQLCMAQVQAHRLLAPDAIAKEHAGLVEAIEGGKPELAARRLGDHLGRACEHLLAHLTIDGTGATGPDG